MHDLRDGLPPAHQVCMATNGLHVVAAPHLKEQHRERHAERATPDHR